MPSARNEHAAALLDGKIYVSGGTMDESQDDVVRGDGLEAYDPVADTWTTLSNLSQGRYGHASAVARGKLCVFGGFDLDDDLDRTNLMEVYSSTSNSWARAADLPTIATMWNARYKKWNCGSVAVAL